MANTLIQKYYFTIPATTGTKPYSYNFKSDELYAYLTGVACVLVTPLPTADKIEIELRDDFKSILSFSPVENWCKNPASVSWDMTNIFRPIISKSAGKNYYLNVKVTNSSSPFTFVALFRQSNEAPDVNIFGQHVNDYDMQSFTIKQPQLGANYQINLPSDYDAVMGINFVGGDTANISSLALDINDSLRELLDPMPVTVLQVTENQPYNNAFYPVKFVSKNKQVNMRLTPLTTIATYTPTDFTVTLLLVK